MRDLDALNAELKAAGAWVFAGGLHPPDTATVVRAHDGDVLTTDGPFTEGKEHIGGFSIITRARPRRRARAGAARPRWRRTLPVEVRPFADMAEPLTVVPGLAPAEIERVFRDEYGRAVAVLVRVFGDIDIAEEAVQDAFADGGQALAGGRAPAEPGRLDHHHRAQPRHRPAAPRGGPRRPARAGRAAARPRTNRRRRARCATTGSG